MVITLPVLLTCVSILFIIWGSTTFALGFFWGKNTILENTETFSENTHVQGKIRFSEIRRAQEHLRHEATRANFGLVWQGRAI